MIEYSQDPRFPMLGFVGVVVGSRCELRHGSMVETRDCFFSDGAWAGEFAEAPGAEDFMSGSAGLVSDDSLVLLTSQVPIDRVFLVERPDRSRATDDAEFLFSNSLPLILGALGDELDPREYHYRSIFLNADLGLSTAAREFTTRAGRMVRIVMNEVVTISDGRIAYRQRRAHRPFHDFAGYRYELAATSSAVMHNSADEARRHPFAPMASLSAGYDSTVAAVMLAEAGFTDTATLLRYTDETETELRDHPGSVVKTLGLDLTEVRRDTWRTRTDLIEATVAAAGTTFMDVVTLAYNDVLPGRLLVAGYSGDSVWSTNNFRTYNDIVQADRSISGRGLAEHRLQTGYAILPLAFVGFSAHPSLFEITHSDEMAPWRLGGTYDRPIARRIAEESGVNRGSFATRKWAGSAKVGTSRRRYTATDTVGRSAELAEILSPAAVDSFLDFVRKTEATLSESELRQLRYSMAADRVLHQIYEKAEALNHKVGRRTHRFGIRGLLPRRSLQLVAQRARVYPDYTYLWPHWGTSLLRDQWY